MLSDLRIRNLAIIEDLEIAFEPGLNVITGETGAGKTILMRALGLVLGDRGGADLVRSGATEAEVEALFAGPAVRRARCEARTRRTATVRPIATKRPSGASSPPEPPARVRQRSPGDARAARGARRAARPRLRPARAPHAAAAPRPSARCSTTPASSRRWSPTMAARYRELAHAEERLRAARDGAEGVAARRDLLALPGGGAAGRALRAGEIGRARPRARAPAARRASARRGGGGRDALYAGDDAVLETVAHHAERLAALASIDPELGEAARLLDEARPAIEEAALRLGARVRAIAADPERLERVEERMALVQRLARKHGCETGSSLDRQRRIERELGDLEGAGADPDELEAAAAAAVSDAWEAADALTRVAGAPPPRLGARITAGLRELALAGAGSRPARAARAGGECRHGERLTVARGTRAVRHRACRVLVRAEPRRGAASARAYRLRR